MESIEDKKVTTKIEIKNNEKLDKQEVFDYLDYKIPKLRLTLVREGEPKDLVSVASPCDLEDYVTPLKNASEEYFISFHLDSKNHVIGYCEVSHGTISSSLVHPREVFKAAMLSNAYSIIVAHNHPSGDLKPSEDDLETTKNLFNASKLIGIELLDHVIVSFKGMHSIREFYPEYFI